MVAQRRFGPLVVLVAAGLAILLARLFQIQVLEHRVWAGEAARLVRSSRVLPYHRGRILDTRGRELVRDEDEYELEFRYRDFRRGHPLGIVAHAWTALIERTLPLPEAAANLESLGQALVELSPADVDRFARGEAVTRAGLPAAVDASAEARGARAADARFYIGRLLSLRNTESRAIRALEPPARERPYVEIVAELRRSDRAHVELAVRADLRSALERLNGLAQLLEDPARPSEASAPEHLVARLQALREDQEDAAATDLFREATGFDPGRIETPLLERFDLDWVARALRWDRARLAAWAHTRRERFERALERDRLPRILVRASVERDDAARVRLLLDGLAGLFARENLETWTDLEELCVIDELPSLASTRLLSAAARPRTVLALEENDPLELADEGGDPWTLFAVVAELAFASSRAETPSAGTSATAERWRDIASSRAGLESPRALDELRRIAQALEARFQRECARGIEALAMDGVNGRIVLGEARLDRAREREKFAVVDAQSRPLALSRRPSLELVHEVARFPDRHRGFEVRETTRRKALVFDRDGVPTAGLLIGGVRRPSQRELFAQSADEERLNELETAILRSDDEDRELVELAARLARPDEWTGNGGVEDHFDADLRGRFGFVQARGLNDEARGAPAVVEAAVDGRDITLTIDAELQNAAQETLAHPQAPPTGESYDRTWFANPVGAIVLATIDGDVLAAASEPTAHGHESAGGRDRERSIARERTLTRPTFNPPGSSFKPFVAAFALQNLGFDPRTRYECNLLADGKPGFEEMHCNKLHVSTDLREALASSCNSYFAQLGLCYEPSQMLAMVETFGFGEPTGVRANRRGGLREDFALPRRGDLERLIGDRATRMRFANGLGLVEATPMQLARATCALATGVLPNMRLVRSIGGVETAREARDVGVDERSLGVVRDAMAACVAAPFGSAHGKDLDTTSLGFTFACKTGSADLGPFVDSPALSEDDRRAMEQGKVRKHTWVVGWFPAEKPRAVVVVYLHEVAETASHTAVWLAGQFLRSEAVKRVALPAENAR